MPTIRRELSTQQRTTTWYWGHRSLSSHRWFPAESPIASPCGRDTTAHRSRSKQGISSADAREPTSRRSSLRLPTQRSFQLVSAFGTLRQLMTRVCGLADHTSEGKYRCAKITIGGNGMSGRPARCSTCSSAKRSPPLPGLFGTPLEPAAWHGGSPRHRSAARLFSTAAHCRKAERRVPGIPKRGQIAQEMGRGTSQTYRPGVPVVGSGAHSG
jgi:hypothetical protein